MFFVMGLDLFLSETNQQVILSDLTGNGPNLYQLQCALTEISHFVASLSDASAGNLERIVPLLKTCLGHTDYTACTCVCAGYAILCAVVSCKRNA